MEQKRRAKCTESTRLVARQFGTDNSSDKCMDSHQCLLWNIINLSQHFCEAESFWRSFTGFMEMNLELPTRLHDSLPTSQGHRGQRSSLRK